MLLYQGQAVQQLSVQSAQAETSINMGSTLKVGKSETFGPIIGPVGSWLNTNVVSNSSIVLQIVSNATGTIYNSTGTIIKAKVALPSSTAYYVTTTNPGVLAVSTKGNVTLMALVGATVSLQTTTHPLLRIGLVFLLGGAMTLIYFSLPKEPPSKKFLDLPL